MLTLLHLEIIMHYHVSPTTPFPRDSEGIRSYREQLVNLDVLKVGEGPEPDPDSLEEGVVDSRIYTVTERGMAWLNRVINTPLPTLRWGWD